MILDSWKDIERIDFIAPDEFWATYGVAMAPVVIERAVPSWRPESEWTLEYLEEAVGHRSASVDRGYFDNEERRGIPVHQILKAIHSAAPLEGHIHPYLRNVDVYNDFPELVASVSPRLSYAKPNWLTCVFVRPGVPDGLVEFFIGGAGSGLGLHYDSHSSHAFITQLRGTKDVVALPPSQTDDLTRIFGSPEKFELGCDPSRYQELEIFRTRLAAGDTLFVPCGWWHSTYHPELSIAVSTNCVNATNWSAFVESATTYNVGAKRSIKKLYYNGIGRLMRAADSLGADFLYRRFD